MKLNHIFSGRPVRVALVAATALLCMAAGWRRVPVSPIPETPARIATARTVAIGGSEVANGGIGSLNTDSTVATLGSASYLQVDQYRQTQLESFAVQGWQAKPYVITYTSSDESICTVDETGLLTAWTPGAATITATATDPENHTVSGVMPVQVLAAEPPLESIQLNRSKVKLRMGGTGTNLTVTTTPAEVPGVLPPVVFSSSDESICTVDETGHVTAVAKGEAVVTAAIGSFTAECRVTVQDTQMADVSGIQVLNFDHSMIAGIGNQAPGKCSLYCLRYARTILDGVPNSGSGMWSGGAVWSAGGSRGYDASLPEVLNKLYSELGAGRPVIVHLQNAPGQGICTTYEYWESSSGWDKVRYPHKATSS